MSDYKKRIKKRLEDPAFAKAWAESEAEYLQTLEEIRKTLPSEEKKKNESENEAKKRN